MTPEIEQALLNRSEAEIVNHHKQFRAHIAQKAAELIMACTDVVSRSPIMEEKIDEWVHAHREKFWFSIVDEEGEKHPPIALIQQVCAAHFKVTVADIISQRRTARVVRPRQVAMHISKRMTLRSYPEIGRRFGNRDHTTILHADRKMERLVQSDTELKTEILALMDKIREQM